jgi:hypothetical protein
MIDADESVRLLINAWKLMIGRLPDGRIHHRDGVASCIGHVPLPFFNFSMNDRPLVDAAEVRRFFENVARATTSCAHPSLIALCRHRPGTPVYQAMGYAPSARFAVLGRADAH